MLKRIIDYFKNNKFNIMLLIIEITYFLLSFFDLRFKLIGMDNYWSYYKYFVCISFVLCGTIIFITIISKKKFDKRLCKIFACTAIILGVIYIALSPLFSGSDEHNHYYRIYEVTEGVIITPTKKVVGSKLPKSLSKTFIAGSGTNTTIKYELIPNMWSIKLNRNDVSQYGRLWTNSYHNTALYSPIQYTPHAIGFIIGKKLNLNPYSLGILGRVFNLITYIILGYIALKIIPKAKLFYMLILLSPNMLQCATTLSADAFTNVIFLLFIALIMKFSYQKEKLNIKNKIVLLMLSIIIALCKIVYLPAVFLILLINYNKYGNKKINKIIYCVIVILIATIFSLLWIKCTNGVFEIEYYKSELQKQFILNNPVEYLMVLIRTFSNSVISFIECLFVGNTMYHSQLKMPSLISFLYILIALLSLHKNNNTNNYKNIEKSLVVFIMLSITTLISTAIYVQCTAQYKSVANSTITGIQGRYFIPVILLIPFITKFKSIKINNHELYKASMIINLITWFYMLTNFMI